MATVKVTKWDWGKVDVVVEKYGATRKHENVTKSSMARLAAITNGAKSEATRKYDYTVTTLRIR